jgi:uncharacterized protein
MAFWFPGLAFGGVFGGALLCLPVTRRLPWGWLLATALYLAIDAEATVVVPHLSGLHWNWAGKAASVVLGLLAMRVFRLSRLEVGLKLPLQGSWPWLWIGLGIAVAWTIVSARNLYPQHVDIETLIYQATLPGLAEELACRGVAFALLLRGFGNERRSSVFAAILITSFCFGLGHMEPPLGPIPHEVVGMMIRNWALQFSYQFLFAALFALMRWRSGSLLGCVLAHGASNVAGTLAAGRVR